MGIEPTTYSFGSCIRPLISFMFFIFWHVLGTRFVGCYAHVHHHGIVEFDKRPGWQSLPLLR
jgi:hypothetical protein